jgi:hypothetical protein
VGAVALALSAALDAGADPPGGHAQAGGPSVHHHDGKARSGNKHRAHTADVVVGAPPARRAADPAALQTGPHPTLAAAIRTPTERGYQVVEGQIAPPVADALCPAEMANVDDSFCIDRWEGSLVEVLPDGREIPWPAFGPIDESRTLRAVSAPNVYPQAYISGAQAARACEAAKKRLCAPVEWRKACMGPQQTSFGYGSERAPGRCNDAGNSPMLRLYPQVAVSWTFVGMTEMNDPRLNQLEQTLAPTGSHSQCTNGYGVFDMVGNLHEWTNDPNGTFQGGYYLDTHKNGDGCSYRTVAHEFTYHDYSTGFRCCASP